MASGGPVKELCEEATCSICLDLFRDPVAIPECGHNFCRACLTRSWGEAAQEASCPQCRRPAQEGSLRPNQQLANMVEILKKCSPAEGKEAEGKGGEDEGGVCEKHGEPLRFVCREDEAPLCVVCRRSREHRGHQVSPLEEAAPQEETVMAARKERVCQKHQEPLKLFCKDHEALICVVCEQSQEHRYHEILPVEEASQEYKDQFCNGVEILQKERNKILECKASIVKESQDLLRQTKGEWQKAVTKFRQLQAFLKEQEELFLVQIEEVENEVTRKRDQHLARLSKEVSSLESIIQEMEEKCQQPASDVLQDARRTLQRYEEKESFENPVTFPLALKWRIWDFSDFSPILEGIKKRLKDTLDSGFQKANVILDSKTAHEHLYLSNDRKSVSDGSKSQNYGNDRFHTCRAVLGCQEFAAGCHFWDVLVGREEEWRVGVARKSVRRTVDSTLNPKEGIWAMGKWSGGFKASTDDELHQVLTKELKRIRVHLNYEGGRVVFFDVDQAALLYEFSGASFCGETLLPFFLVKGKGSLTISS